MNNFIKMHACGNDFLIFFKKIKLFLLNKFCNKKTGISCDQIFFIKKIFFQKNILKIKIYNNNLSEALNCGNGIRCLSFFFLKKKESSKILTFFLNKNYIYSFKKKKIFFTIFKFPKIVKNIFIRINNFFIKIVFVNLINFHIVIFVNNIKSKNIVFIQKIIKKFFVDSFNIEFIKIINKYEIYVRIFERGVGETYSCGSGIISSCCCIYNNLKNKNKIFVRTIGGECNVFPYNKFIIILGNVNFCFLGFI